MLCLRSIVIALAALGIAHAGKITKSVSPATEIALGDSCWSAQQSWNAFLHYTEAQKNAGDDRQLAWRFARTYTAFALTARTPDEEQWNYARAKEFAERAVGYDPNNEEAVISIAVYYGWRTFMEQDNESKLRASRLMHQYVTRALALNPNDDFAWNIHGQWNREVAKLSWVEKLVVKVIYGGLPDASFDQAVSDLRRAIQLRPQRIMHYVELGKTLFAMGEDADARATLQHALDLPHNDGVDEKVKDEARKLLAGK